MPNYHLVNLETSEVEFILDLLKDAAYTSPRRKDDKFVHDKNAIEAKFLLMLEKDAL